MAKCEYTGCRYEIEIDAEEWSHLLDKALEYDINKGGFYDARIAVINLWCSPEDKPINWEEVLITPKGLKYPRAYVGGIHGQYLAPGEWPEELREEKAITTILGIRIYPGVPALVRLHFTISPYEKAETIVGYPFIGYTYHKGKIVKAEDFATDHDLEWMKRKFNELREIVKRQR